MMGVRVGSLIWVVSCDANLWIMLFLQMAGPVRPCMWGELGALMQRQQACRLSRASLRGTKCMAKPWFDSQCMQAKAAVKAGVVAGTAPWHQACAGFRR